MRHSIRWLAGIAAVMFSGSSALAGLSIDKQGRYVEVSLSSADPGDGAPQLDRQSAPNDGSFSGDVQLRQAGTNFDNQVRATMQSELAGEKWLFSGILDIATNDIRDLSVPSAEAVFNAILDFTIDGPYDYDLQGGANVSGSNPGDGQLAEMIELMSPTGTDPGGNRSGTLEPGTYRLTLVQQIATNDRSADHQSEYQYTFSIEPAKNPPNSVPLPPAAWPGLAMLGGMGIVRVFRQQVAG